jgi:hypothetical protein
MRRNNYLIGRGSEMDLCFVPARAGYYNANILCGRVGAMGARPLSARMRACVGPGLGGLGFLAAQDPNEA